MPTRLVAVVPAVLTLEERAARARALLGRADLRALGAGQEGVVLTDGVDTFKLFDGWPAHLRAARRGALARWLGRFEGCRHLVPLRALADSAGVPVLVQPFAPSTPWHGAPRAGVVGFLRECLREGVAYDCFNPSNFRLAGADLRLIDYGADLRPFSWNGWTYMARRAWVSLRYAGLPDLKGVLRATIADWETPELGGFEAFLGEVLDGAPTTPAPATSAPLPEEAWPVADDVTLLVKTCYQEGDTLLAMTRHLVRQFEGPHRFAARRVVLDARPDGYPRQYSVPAPNAARSALDALLREGTVDRVDVAPLDGASIREVHRRWFGLDVEHPASASGVPVAPQLWAFDLVSTRYVLQVDADAIVGRRDRAHDYLGEMRAALEEHADAVSVGFQIAHVPGWAAPYDAPPGGHCPEVRCGLLDLERLRAQRPLPNEARGGRLALTWYRSVERAQRERGLRSLRGGDGRSFYVHPPNERKADRVAWFDAVDRVAQGLVPPVQFDRVDLTGGGEVWAVPGLRQEHVFLVAIDGASRAWFPRLWASLEAQSRRDWAAVVVDPTFDPAVEDVARRHPDRVALVRNPMLSGAALARHALARHVRDPAALVIPLRADDELLGGAALSMVRRRTTLGARVIHAHVLHGQRPEIAPIAARLDALGGADGEDPVTALLGGLGGDAVAPTPGPLLRRERGAPVASSMALAVHPPPLRRPSPVGELVRSTPWRDGGGHVLFVRHAEKLDGSRFCTVEENRARALSRDGFDEAEALGRTLHPAPDLVLCAPVVRARQTAEALARGAGVGVPVVEDDALFCGRFHDHARWLSMKRELGWEELIERWLRGEVPASVATPAAEAVSALLGALRTRLAGARRAVVITQGHVNTALFHRAEGLLDFSGGPLYGFWLSRKHRAWGET